MIIAIDFDGTIVTDEYPEIGVVKPHAKETINRWKAEGHYIIIWTCRTGHYLEMAKRWLEFMGIEYDSINQSCPENVNMYRIDTRKVFADVYIDDKGLIELPDWRTINELVTFLTSSNLSRQWREGFGDIIFMLWYYSKNPPHPLNSKKKQNF